MDSKKVQVIRFSNHIQAISQPIWLENVKYIITCTPSLTSPEKA